MRQALDLSKILSKSLIFALLVWVAFQPEPVFAKIYKYKDDNGKTHFTDDASKIPARYRNKNSVKRFKGVHDPAPASGTSGQALASGDEDNVEKEEGLSEKDVGLMNKTIQIFKAGAALGSQYENKHPSFANGQGAIDAIQGALPSKVSLADELAGTKVPELKEALGFLTKSIAVDKDTKSIGVGLKRRIVGIFNRLKSEGKEQAALVKKLEKGLKDSEKKKAEAEKKKVEESKKEKKK
jgi:hypothetical protein